MINEIYNVNIHSRVFERWFDVVAERIDLAVRNSPFEDSDFVARRLLQVRRITVTPLAHTNKLGAPTTPPDLAQHACILAPPQTGVRRFDNG